MPVRFSRLTRPAIRRLKPGEKITEHGITAERLQDGDTRYSVNIMVDGERIHRVIGRQSERVTRTQAEQFIAKARTDAKEGRLGLPRGRKVGLTFTNASKLYMKLLGEADGKSLAEKDRRGATLAHLVPVQVRTVGEIEHRGLWSAGTQAADISRIRGTSVASVSTT